MRILQICHQYPYPPDRGGKIDSFNFTRQYSALGHDVSLVTMVHDDDVAEDGLRQFCKELYTLRIDRRNRISRAAVNLLSSLPYNVSKYTSAEFLALVDKVFLKDRIEIVHVDHLHAASYGAYLSARYGVPIVLRQQNIETELMLRYAREEKNPLKKTFALLQWAKLKPYERKICASYDYCACITHRDVAHLRKWSKSIDARFVPAGVDFEKYSYHGSSKRNRGVILSLGSVDWLPNQAGLEWFVRDVFWRIKREVEFAKLEIVGRGKIGSGLLRLCNSTPGVTILGYVEDDADLLHSASIMVVPLFVGGGVRLKVLNGFASGIPVVSTSIGCEGLTIADGRECYIRDEPVQFAAQISSILLHPEETEAVTRAARALVESAYDWKDIVSRQAHMLEDVLKSKQAKGS